MSPRHDAEYLDDPPRVRFVRTLPIGHEQLWGLVSDPAGLADWFPSPEVTYEPHEGGSISLSGDPYDPEGSTGVVHAFVPGERFSFDWEKDRLDLTVAQSGLGQSTLELVNTLSDEGGAARNAAGWDMCLDALEAAATGGLVLGDDSVESFLPHLAHYRDQGFPDDGWTPGEPTETS